MQPYSQSHSGIALQLKDGTVYRTPLKMPHSTQVYRASYKPFLIMINLAGKDIHAIDQAKFVESKMQLSNIGMLPKIHYRHWVAKILN